MGGEAEGSLLAGGSSPGPPSLAGARVRRRLGWGGEGGGVGALGSAEGTTQLLEEQPLSSNPLSDVMTLSNLDHLLKHVPGSQVESPGAASRTSPSAPPAPAPLSAAQSQAGCWVAPLRPGGRDKDTERPARAHAPKHALTFTRGHLEMGV